MGTRLGLGRQQHHPARLPAADGAQRQRGAALGRIEQSVERRVASDGNAARIPARRDQVVAHSVGQHAGAGRVARARGKGIPRQSEKVEHREAGDPRIEGRIDGSLLAARRIGRQHQVGA